MQDERDVHRLVRRHHLAQKRDAGVEVRRDRLLALAMLSWQGHGLGTGMARTSAPDTSSSAVCQIRAATARMTASGPPSTGVSTLMSAASRTSNPAGAKTAITPAR